MYIIYCGPVDENDRSVPPGPYDCEECGHTGISDWIVYSNDIDASLHCDACAAAAMITLFNLNAQACMNAI